MPKKKKKSWKKWNLRKYLQPKIITTVLICSCFFLYKIFGSVYIIVVLIISIFLNLGDKENSGISAYSVFNKGRKHLLGELRMTQIEKELTYANKNLQYDSDENLLTVGDLESKNKNKKMMSTKMRNKRCPCGSDKKYKNCCGNFNANSSSDY